MFIDPGNRVPIYEQIVAHFRNSIAAGVYRPGESLPSVRTAALRCVVNPNTVQRAYQELEREGLIETRKGREAFVSAGGPDAARRNAAEVVRGRFVEGVQIGRAARIEHEAINVLYQQAMCATGAADQDAPP